MRDRDCASKMAALTPPPCKQSILGRGFVLGFVVGILEMGGDSIKGIARNVEEDA